MAASWVWEKSAKLATRQLHILTSAPFASWLPVSHGSKFSIIPNNIPPPTPRSAPPHPIPIAFTTSHWIFFLIVLAGVYVEGHISSGCKSLFLLILLFNRIAINKTPGSVSENWHVFFLREKKIKQCAWKVFSQSWATHRQIPHSPNSRARGPTLWMDWTVRRWFITDSILWTFVRFHASYSTLTLWVPHFTGFTHYIWILPPGNHCRLLF